MNLLLVASNKIISNEKMIDFHSLWFWLSIIEFLVIFFLIYKIKSKKELAILSDLDIESIKKAKGNKIDMDSLMDNIHNSRNLYKELSRKCHPERFVNDERQVLAEEIFKEISENERNHEKLSILKLRAENELKINFKSI